MPSAERLTHLDSLRAALMFLGIVLHTGFVYISNQGWLVSSSTTSYFFDYLILILHTFRMPAFFLLSGFLFALVLLRTDPASFFRARARRILIPLFTAGILLNAAQYLVFYLFNTNSGMADTKISSCESIVLIYSGCWTIHLWFLVHLFYYFILGMPVVWLLKRLPPFTLPSPASVFWPLSVGLIILVAQPVLSLYYRGFFSAFSYLPLLDSEGRLVRYLPFFVMGLILARCRTGPGQWTRFGWAAVLCLPISWTALLWGYDPEFDSRSVFLMDGRVQAWLYYIVAFQTTAALITLAARIPRPTPRFASHLADTALTVYLVHHLIIFLLALLFINTGLPIGWQFLLIVALTTGLSLAFHRYIVMPSAAARFFFNGRSTSAASVPVVSAIGR